MSGDEISCPEVIELLTDSRDGALVPRVDLDVTRHLTGCAGCRGYLDQFTATIAATGPLREDSVTANVRESLIQAFRNWPRPSA
jgi:hypothetical protein